MKKILEIRAAEGGKDAKLFVNDLATIYEKTFQKLGWKSTRLAERDGFLSLEITGKKLTQLEHESGGHRIQRVPPTENRGRVHTSTVTVAVLDVDYDSNSNLNLREDHHFHFELFKSTGCGGQKKNKTLSAVKCIHLPTGVKQQRDSRNQHANRRDARAAVEKILDSMANGESALNKNTERSGMVGSGMRGDKIRTYRFQEDIIIDHRTNRKFNLKKVLRGNADVFWD